MAAGARITVARRTSMAPGARSSVVGGNRGELMAMVVDQSSTAAPSALLRAADGRAILPLFCTKQMLSWYGLRCPDALKAAGILQFPFSKWPMSAVLQEAAVASIARQLTVPATLAMTPPHMLPAPPIPTEASLSVSVKHRSSVRCKQSDSERLASCVDRKRSPSLFETLTADEQAGGSKEGAGRVTLTKPRAPPVNTASAGPSATTRAVTARNVTARASPALPMTARAAAARSAASRGVVAQPQQGSMYGESGGDAAPPSRSQAHLSLSAAAISSRSSDSDSTPRDAAPPLGVEEECGL